MSRALPRTPETAALLNGSLRCVTIGFSMTICVLGLWHLGCVTAACVAERFPVIACDPDSKTVQDLRNGQPPIFEPGLKELIDAQTAAGRLTVTADVSAAVSAADIVWVTFDTPVDDTDTADAEFLLRQIRCVFPNLRDGVVVLISSQVPVGFTAKVEAEFRCAYPQRRAGFAYSPENLRLGSALDSFRKAQRIVVGVRSENDKRSLESMLGRFCGSLEWMSVESAEMTKHALNAFLANSIAFMNEIACLGELVGADGKEVERGLKTDGRIGPRAYLSPGGPFSGGTLARDVSALGALADRVAIPAPILKAIYASNEAHKGWPGRKLLQFVGDLAGKRVAVLGLTYKPRTDTLRRSGAVEFCQWLNARGANVQAYDPAVRSLPQELQTYVRLCGSLGEALNGADAAVIATDWPEFKNISCDDLRAMRGRIVIDTNCFLDESVRRAGDLIYAAVGYIGNRA